MTTITRDLSDLDHRYSIVCLYCVTVSYSYMYNPIIFTIPIIQTFLDCGTKTEHVGFSKVWSARFIKQLYLMMIGWSIVVITFLFITDGVNSCMGWKLYTSLIKVNSPTRTNIYVIDSWNTTNNCVNRKLCAIWSKSLSSYKKISIYILLSNKQIGHTDFVIYDLRYCNFTCPGSWAPRYSFT